MVEFRPHIMTWTPLEESTTEPGTGYEIPGVPGEPKAVACRFRLDSTKHLRNQDNSVSLQVGQIRVDVGSELPALYSMVKVIEVDELMTSGEIIQVNGSDVHVLRANHFQGVILDIYKGQLTWRLDV